jgi:prepilin-type N-terminal cleavage/methylation domain-containing protein
MNPRAPIFKPSGVTLLELLVVLAILGILGTITLGTYLREARVLAVRQQATQLQTDLESLRSSAIRFNRTARFTKVSSTKYTLNIPTGTTVRTLTRDLKDSGVQLLNGQNFSYSAPNAEVGATDFAFRLTSGQAQFFVKVIGVTGKVVLSAQN